MEKETKRLITVIVVMILVIVALRKLNDYFFPVKFNKMGNRVITEAEIKASFQKIKIQYGTAFARKLEQLFRRETAHFKSGQFLKTLSPGMEVRKNSDTLFPFGWGGSLDTFASSRAILKANFYTSTVKENGTGIQKTFIGFPTIDDSVSFVAWFIKNKRGGEFGKWYSLNPSSAMSYENSLNQIIPRYV